jgi:hypothetical protein
MKYIALFLLIIINGIVMAQPEPGDVFREYIWLPTMVKAEGGKFLRVGGRLDYKTNQDHFPADRQKEGYIPLNQFLELKNAVKAEMIIEKLGSHDDTKNLRVSINRHPSIIFPPSKGIPEPESAYMHHNYPIVNIPVEQLEHGLNNTFRFDVDTLQRWNWPQNIIYGVIFRIYYDKQLVKDRMEITGVYPNGFLQEFQSLGIENPESNINRVEYVGYYDDINYEGDGIYKQWHYHFFRGRVIHHIGTAYDYPYDIEWNTFWLPDQGDIKVAARIVDNTGLIYMTKSVDDLSLNRDYSIELCKPYEQPRNWVTREAEFEVKIDVNTHPAEIEEAKLYWVSWSPCYANGIYINDVKVFDKEGPCYEYFSHEIPLDNISMISQGTNLIKTGKEPLHDGKMVHGMEIQWPGIMMKVKTRSEARGIRIFPDDYENRSHFRIETKSLTYYYDVKGGGFSRIIDKYGNDWISFKMQPWGEYPAAAASAFRGLPNTVFQGEDNGAGHPGHNMCRSWLEDGKIFSESMNGKWKWSWEFNNDHAILEMLSVDKTRNYWFLYEGTPGGEYDPENTYFGTEKAGPEPVNYDFYNGDIYWSNFNWMYAGNLNTNGIIFMIQLIEDECSDMISLLGNSKSGIDSQDGMTVFGFGRDKDTNPLLKGKQKFIIGYFPKKIENRSQHKALGKYIQNEFLSQYLIK